MWSYATEGLGKEVNVGTPGHEEGCSPGEDGGALGFGESGEAAGRAFSVAGLSLESDHGGRGSEEEKEALTTISAKFCRHVPKISTIKNFT